MSGPVQETPFWAAGISLARRVVPDSGAARSVSWSGHSRCAVADVGRVGQEQSMVGSARLLLTSVLRREPSAIAHLVALHPVSRDLEIPLVTLVCLHPLRFLLSAPDPVLAGPPPVSAGLVTSSQTVHDSAFADVVRCELTMRRLTSPSTSSVRLRLPMALRHSGGVGCSDLRSMTTASGMFFLSAPCPAVGGGLGNPTSTLTPSLRTPLSPSTSPFLPTKFASADLGLSGLALSPSSSRPRLDASAS